MDSARKEADRYLPPIGQRLRAAREERGQSLSQVAMAAGLPRGFLSRLELDDTTVSLSCLQRICTAMGIEAESLSNARQSNVMRRNDRVQPLVSGEGVVSSVLTSIDEPRARLVEIHLDPLARRDDAPEATSDALVIVYVLDGTLELCFGASKITLSVGDTMTFDPRVEYVWCNPSSLSSTTILVVEMPAVS
jgi:transcriptional regulator with XRE-family HTH domain